MLKKLFLFLFVSAALAPESYSSNINSACEQKNSGIYSVISAKIKDSSLASLNKLSCKEISTINSYNKDKLNITTGRKRGNYKICLSDDASNPCKHSLGIFNESTNPSDMLAEVFGIEQPKSDYLNETVERLFFQPSLLID